MTDTNEESLKNRFKNSPMFAASLSSKELFHSNTLAWLTEKWPDMMTIVWQKLYGTENTIEYGGGPVLREAKHIDLQIPLCSTDGKKLIVEIKVQAIATRTQLEKYRNSIGDGHRYLLLQLLENRIEGLDVWKEANFKSLAKQLRKMLSSIKKSDKCKHEEPNHIAFLELYIDLIEDLNELVHSFELKFMKPSAIFSLIDTHLTDYVPTKLHVMLKKLYFSWLTEQIYLSIKTQTRESLHSLQLFNSERNNSEEIPTDAQNGAFVILDTSYQNNCVVELSFKVPLSYEYHEGAESDENQVAFICALQGHQFREMILARHLPREEVEKRHWVAQRFLDNAKQQHGSNTPRWFTFDNVKWSRKNGSDVKGKGRGSCPITNYGVMKNNSIVVFYKYINMMDNKSITNKNIIDTFIAYYVNVPKDNGLSELAKAYGEYERMKTEPKGN